MATLLQTDPQDLFLDPDTMDVVIVNGDAGFSFGLDGVAQACRLVCSLIMGEWFLNLDVGIPYFNRNGVDPNIVIMGQQYNQTRVCAPFRAVLALVPGVASVNSVTSTFDAPTRTATVTWKVTTVFGGTVTDSLSLGF